MRLSTLTDMLAACPVNGFVFSHAQLLNFLSFKFLQVLRAARRQFVTLVYVFVEGKKVESHIASPLSETALPETSGKTFVFAKFDCWLLGLIYCGRRVAINVHRPV